jgi:localization factor PodJL
VRKDLPAAIGWYGAAAALGHPEAQYNLGIAHIEGIGTQYDPKAAATFFESAANGGVMEAAYNLGLIHENGLLGAINADRALYWYKKAADRGSPEAQSAMDQLVKSLGISKTQAQEYIARAASAIAPAAPPPASPAPAAAPPARRSQLEVESLRPEDKVSVSEVASYLPQMTENDLAAPAAAAAQTVNRPVKDRAIIAQIQEQLVRMGLYPGPADGVTGPQTEDAIRAYQVANNLPGDGRATEALLLHLLTNEMNATAAPNDTEYGSRVE